MYVYDAMAQNAFCMCAFPFFACSTCLLFLSSFVFPMLSLLSDYSFMVGGSVSYLL